MTPDEEEHLVPDPRGDLSPREVVERRLQALTGARPLSRSEGRMLIRHAELSIAVTRADEAAADLAAVLASAEEGAAFEAQVRHARAASAVAEQEAVIARARLAMLAGRKGP